MLNRIAWQAGSEHAFHNIGSKGLEGLTVLMGFVAIVTNSIVMMFGRIEAVPFGGTGVVATLLLASCLLRLQSGD